MPDNDKITVMLVEPMHFPEVIDIPNNNGAFMKEINAENMDRIMSVIPNVDAVYDLLCDEKDLPFNRPLFDDNGKMELYTKGSFILCAADAEDRRISLSPEQITELEKMFHDPYVVYVHDNATKPIEIGIDATPVLMKEAYGETLTNEVCGGIWKSHMKIRAEEKRSAEFENFLKAESAKIDKEMAMEQAQEKTTEVKQSKKKHAHNEPER